jgi:hypothetical protein
MIERASHSSLGTLAVDPLVSQSSFIFEAKRESRQNLGYLINVQFLFEPSKSQRHKYGI